MPTREKQLPDRAEYSCVQCLGAQVSSYLNVSVKQYGTLRKLF